MTLKVDTIQNESSSEANVVLNSNGSISIPSQIKHVGDDDTLIEFETDTVKLQTAGSPRLVAKSDGKVGIGSNATAPVRTLEVSVADNQSFVQDFQQNYNCFALRNSTDDKCVGMEFKIGTNGQAAITAIETADAVTDLVLSTRNSNDKYERLRITGDGKVGINDETPRAKLHLRSQGHTVQGRPVHFILEDNNNLAADTGPIINFETVFTTNGDPTTMAMIHGGKANATSGAYDGYLRFFVTQNGQNPAERVRIDHQGKLLIGSGASNHLWRLHQVIGSYSGSGQRHGALFQYGEAAGTGPTITFQKNRSNTGATTTVQSGDNLGVIEFRGVDNASAYNTGCNITGRCDAAPSGGQVPGRLEFNTNDGTGIGLAWEMTGEGKFHNFLGNHHYSGATVNIDTINAGFGVHCSASPGTNGQAPAGTGPNDSTYLQSEWGNKTMVYGSAFIMNGNYNLSQANRCNVTAYFHGANCGGGDNNFPASTATSAFWQPNGAGIWATSGGGGGQQGTASIRADCSPVYFSTTAFYARVNNAVTSGKGHGLTVDLGGHPFGAENVGVYVRQINNGNMAQSTGFVYRRGDTSGNRYAMKMYSSTGNLIGWILCSHTSTSYNSASDYRLKENVEAVTNGIELIKKMPVKSFNFIGSEDRVTGFLAHEIQEAVPYAVTGEKDAVKQVAKEDENGDAMFSDEEDENGVKKAILTTAPDYQGVDYGKLTPILTAALQEAIAKIETLEAKVAALEAK